jgi:hypothetical protein
MKKAALFNGALVAPISWTGGTSSGIGVLSEYGVAPVPGLL